MKLAVIVVGCAVAMIVVGVVAFEVLGWLVERKARKRFEKMTPEERFKYQNEMRKSAIVVSR